MPSQLYDIYQNKTRNLPRFFWTFVPIVLLLISYSFSLELQYVEGDDASSVIYHAMGRDASLQPPYANYQVLADTLFSGLPASEPALRTTMMLLSAVANIVTVVFILQLIFDWLEVSDAKTKTLIALAVIIGVPEFFYLGLVYTPTLFAMSMVILAHLLLHRVDFATRAGSDWTLITCSFVLFCLGATFRLDIVTYGAVITADLMFLSNIRTSKALGFRQRLGIGLVWGLVALLGWFLALFLLGYTPSSVLGIGEWATDWIIGFSLQTFGIVQTLASPLIILLFGIGLFILIRRRSFLLIILFVSIMVITPWIPTGVPKLLFVAIPMILTTSMRGLLAILAWRNQSIRRFTQVGLVVIALFPWFVGIQARIGDTAWGPVFDLQDFDRPLNESNSFRVALFDVGAVVPTSEGPRALFGHFFAIFGGQWRVFVQSHNVEIATAIATARQRRLPVYILDGSGSNYIAKLLEQGFTTADSRDVSQRVFVHTDGSTIILAKQDSDVIGVLEVPEGAAPVEQAVIVGDPSTLRAWYLAMPETLEKIGASTAVFTVTQTLIR